jgi:transposase
MSQKELPMDLPEAKTLSPSVATTPDQARLKRPVRNQVEMLLRDLDSLIPDDHPVRAIWEMIKRLDLAAFYTSIKSVTAAPGRPASDPQVLLALWIYGTVEGVGSARRLDRLCHEHDAYRWLSGAVPVDYHTLADFRVCHQADLDKLLTEIIASMMHNKLVTLKEVAQDGTRVRVSVGSGSFHRKATLERCLAEAEEQVQRLALERDRPDTGVNLREQAARERAARERMERVQAALRELPAVEAVKAKQRRTKSKADRAKVTEARVSTTDANTRVIKMADGGFRPACNVQFATDTASGVIVGAGVVSEGSDAGQAEGMVNQIELRSGVRPESYLIDGGFAQRETVTRLTKRQITVYAPVRSPNTKISGREQTSPRSDDTPEVIAWRVRMETEEAKAIYKRRAATAEWTNAQTRHHGLNRFTVRGLGKELSLVLLVAIAHNLLRWVALTS